MRKNDRKNPDEKKSKPSQEIEGVASTYKTSNILGGEGRGLGRRVNTHCKVVIDRGAKLKSILGEPEKARGHSPKPERRSKKSG